MSRHRQLEGEPERYKLIVKNLPDGIFTFDLEGKVTSVNNVILSYGYEKGAVIGKSLLDFIPEKHWPMISEHLAELAKGKSTQGEVELKTKKGTVMAEFRSSPIKKRGKIIGFQSVVRDITRQKLMEEELRESEEKYRLIFENSPDGIITLDHMGNITSVNDVVLNYGYKREELVGKSLLEFVPFVSEKYRPILDKHVASVTSGKIAQGEMEFNTPKGRLTMWFRASPMKKRGEIVGFQLILIDITKRKSAEARLRESEERLRQLIEYAPDAIYINDLNGNFIDGNKQAENLTGYKREELIGKNMLEVGLLPEKYIPKAMEALEKNMRGQKTGPDEFELIRKDGSTILVEISTFPVKREEKVEVIGIARDITERKAMEGNLRESEERFRTLFESIQDPVGIFVGREGRLIDYNKAFKKLSGYTDEELKDRIFLDFVHPDDRALVLERYRTTYPEEQLPLIYEIKGLNKKGEIVPTEISVGTYKKKGRVIGINVMHRDITERKAMEKKLQEYAEHLEEMVEERTKELKESQEALRESEERLRESEEKYRKVFEEALDAIFLHDAETGILIDCNRAASRLVGREKSELFGTHQRILHPPGEIEGEFSRTFKQHVKEKEGQVLETQVITKRGEIKEVTIKANVFELKGKKIIQGVFRDITERKRMEEQLLKSERLAAIGQLATMVGHDLRNPLTSLQNACYYLKMKLGASKDEKLKKMFRIIDKEIGYSNKIIEDLLDFSRVKKPELEKLDIISSIQDALAQLKFPENITITTKFSEVPTIEADPDQLRRVFHNIALNAMQAMPDGGELTILTRKNGNFVEAAFTDTGVGISEENMDKLFTPLFTTKAQGVGLGLAICKNLVEGHNGSIGVKSKVGEGSTFTVKLPVHQTRGGEKQT